MSFYLAVPSDSSHKFFPQNKISSYNTKLAKEIILYDDYEIGLSSIHFPLTYYNVRKGEFKVFKITEKENNSSNIIERKTLFSEIESVPEGRYPTENMVEEIFKRVSKKYFEVNMSNFDRKIKLRIGKHYDIAFNPALVDFLGREFTPKPKEGNIFEKSTVYTGRNAIDYQRVCHNLYVYCDLIEPRTVGDTQVSLLTTIPNPIGGSFGDTVEKSFDSIRYYKLGKNRFDTVKIDIVSDTGKHIPFEDGKVFIELHLRKVKRR